MFENATENIIFMSKIRTALSNKKESDLNHGSLSGIIHQD